MYSVKATPPVHKVEHGGKVDGGQGLVGWQILMRGRRGKDDQHTESGARSKSVRYIDIAISIIDIWQNIEYC